MRPKPSHQIYFSGERGGLPWVARAGVWLVMADRYGWGYHPDVPHARFRRAGLALRRTKSHRRGTR